ncbi:hypothetical protein ABVT39_008055 [Epinephelus coioides]
MSKRQLSLFQAFERKRTKPATITNTQSSENEGASSSQAGREDEVASYAASSSASLAIAATASADPSPEPAEDTQQQQMVVSAAAYEDDLGCVKAEAQYLLPDKLPLLTDNLWMEIKEEYGALMPSVDTADMELNLWRQHNRPKDDTPVTSDILQVLRLTADFYPNVHTVVKVLLTMPVPSASAERSLSCLCRLKTYLWNTMTDKRLSGLALMNIHHDIPIDSEAILREFDATGRRRLHFK